MCDGFRVRVGEFPTVVAVETLGGAFDRDDASEVSQSCHHLVDLDGFGCEASSLCAGVPLYRVGSHHDVFGVPFE